MHCILFKFVSSSIVASNVFLMCDYYITYELISRLVFFYSCCLLLLTYSFSFTQHFSISVIWAGASFEFSLGDSDTAFKQFFAIDQHDYSDYSSFCFSICFVSNRFFVTYL